MESDGIKITFKMKSDSGVIKLEPFYMKLKTNIDKGESEYQQLMFDLIFN